MISRRSVIAGLGGLLDTAGLPVGLRTPRAQTLAMAELRGGFDAAEAGICRERRTTRAASCRT